MKYFLLLCILLTSVACKTDNNQYTLKGTAQGFADGSKAYLFEVDDNNATIAVDTLTITNGTFEATYEKVDGSPLQMLRFDDANGQVLFFVENENLSAQIYADSIASSYVVGGKQNELYQEYMASMRNFNQKRVALNETFQEAQRSQDASMVEEIKHRNLTLVAEEKAYRREFAMKNGNTVFGLMLLNDLFKRGDLTGSEIQSILEGLSPKMSQHRFATGLQEQITIAMRAEIGGMAPEFEAPTPSGENLALKDVLGTYTIVDFWASWCRPCRRENPNVVRVYEKYHDKGLNIISVSLDKPGQKDRWIQAISDDNMNWHHVSNLQFWQDPIAKEYNVRSIPATFLLDSEGKIIDKNLRGAALDQRISQLLD